jgi:hypothetical protein
MRTPSSVRASRRRRAADPHPYLARPAHYVMNPADVWRMNGAVIAQMKARIEADKEIVAATATLVEAEIARIMAQVKADQRRTR